MPTKMEKEIQYLLYRSFLENPRITLKELSRTYTSVRALKRTQSAQPIVDESFKKGVFLGPYLYISSGVQIKLSRKKGKVNETGISLVGAYSHLHISNSRGNLQYARCVAPSFPAKVVLESSLDENLNEEFDTCFSAHSRITPDTNPLWDELDWNLYRVMRNLRQDFLTVSRKLNISREEVKKRFGKVVKDCRIAMGFFPQGYLTYSPLLLSMKTDCETGMEKWLSALDRSSWLFKIDDVLMVYLFSTHVNLTCLKFLEMQHVGIIRNVRVSIPLSREFLFI